MKKIVYAVFALALASCATTPNSATTASPAPAATAVPTPAAAKAPPQKTTTYEEALPASIKSFYPNGDPSGSITFKYTAEGRLLLQETLNGNGVLVETRSGKAVGPVWRITVTNAQNGEVVSYEDRVVGPAGELLVQTFFNAKEVPQAINEYSYDKAGRKVQWLAKAGSGGLQARTVYSYDDRGNNTKTEVYDAGGALTNVFVSTYDGQHISTRQGFDAAQNLVEQTNFTWKDQLEIKEETVKPLLRTIEYTYGDKAVPTGIVSSVRGKVVERQVLEYQWFTKTKTLAP